MTTFSYGLALVVLLAQGLTGLAGTGEAPHQAHALALVGTSSDGSGPVRLVLFQSEPPEPAPQPPNVISSRRLMLRSPQEVGPDLQKMPSQWLGVRLTPVPGPLAAHIGERGVMIANVIKASPADEAGLEQYDVIVSLDSQQVADSQDLFAALEDTKAGQSVPLTVIRGGQKKELTITPAERPANPQLDLKYDEPEDVIEQEMRLRGHKLMPGPGGAWQWEELGPMYSFPDILRDLRLPDFDQFITIEPGAEDEAERDVQARVEVRVHVDKDGGTLTIWRDEDGKINVKRVDPAGNESSATYEDMEKFEQGDPDAYRAYRPFSSSGPDSWMYITPQREKLGKLRRDFQVEIECKLREALDRAKAAEEEAGRAVERVRERLEQYRSGVDAGEPGKAEEQRTVIQKTQRLMVQVDDGRVSVTVDDGQGPRTYEFQSKEDFKQQEPELYEKCRQLLE